MHSSFGIICVAGNNIGTFYNNTFKNNENIVNSRALKMYASNKVNITNNRFENLNN